MHLLPELVQENLHFCMHYFSKTKNKAAEKISGQYFSIVQGHMQKFSSVRGRKKKRPKKSLTLVMHWCPFNYIHSTADFRFVEQNSILTFVFTGMFSQDLSKYIENSSSLVAEKSINEMAVSRQEKIARYKEQKEQERRLKVVKIFLLHCEVLSTFATKLGGYIVGVGS